MRSSRGWVAVAALLVGAGCVLRWSHLGAASLWWDELVEIRMADAPTLLGVVARVRTGVPAGSGNAGAVPLDYVLLWAWLHLVPMPAPETLESYFRFPSFLWSCALLPLAGWWTWRTFGRAAGLATLALTAGAVPLVLYAAEARFYSLFCLFALVNLVTFAGVVRDPDRAGAWIGYGVGALLLFLAGLFGLLVLPWQLATLAVTAARRPGTTGRRARLALAGVAIALVATVGLYFADTNLATQSVRGPQRLPWWPNLVATLGFFAAGAPALVWALGLAPVLALAVAWRRHRPLVPVVAATTAIVVTSLPVILSIAEAKDHIFHPRHALFLLPLLLVLLGTAIGGLADALAPRRLAAPVALLVAATLVAPAAWRYAQGPWRFFAATKMLHDFRGITQIIRERTRDYGPNDRYLLIATRGAGGHLGNPVLAWYLEWYGIGHRVVLRGTTDPAATIALARTQCWKHCRSFGTLVERDLGLTRAYQQTRAKLWLLGHPVMRWGWPGNPRDIAFAVYPPLERWHLPPLDGYRTWRRPGLQLYELARPPLP
jgi:hypothetical protein